MTAPLAFPSGVCVSIACEEIEQAIEIAKGSEMLADVLEIRLDRLSHPEVAPFVQSLSKPLLFTNRPVWEGGAFEGAEEERIDLLLRAIELDCALVDLELKTASELHENVLEVLKRKRTGLIVSWHDFTGTPASGDLIDILRQQMESGAHIGKIVTTANDYKDVLRVLNLQAIAEKHNFPLIAFCMGPVGRISRLARSGAAHCSRTSPILPRWGRVPSPAPSLCARRRASSCGASMPSCGDSSGRQRSTPAPWWAAT